MKLLPLSAALLLSTASFAADQTAIISSPDRLNWVKAEPPLPSGTEVALVLGDPSKAGDFIIRAKMPAGTVIRPHTHPDPETVTVLSGTMHFGMGSKMDKSSATKLGAGGFVAVPADHPHYVFTDEDTIIQVTGKGPFRIRFLDAETQ